MRLCAVLMLVVCGLADALGNEAPERQRFLLVPYVWAINVDAELGLGPLSLPISLNTAELLSDVDYGAMGYLQWNFGDNFLFVEALGVSFDAEQFAPVFNQAVLADFGLIEFGYGRHFAVGPDSGVFKDLVISPHIGILAGSLDVEVSGTLSTNINQDWTGIVVGGMATGPIGNSFSYSMRAEYSDFSSELEDYYTALIAVSYHLNNNIALGVGYRLMGGNYADDGIVIKADFDGALIGLQFSW